MESPITYRIASEKDIDAINSFYNRIYHSNRDFKKFNWEYNTAPAGKAIYVVAEADGDIVGTQCAIPYYLITHDNKTILSGKSEDTLVSPKHRGKSIFDNMYHLLIEACKARNITCIWGFTYAAKPFKKLGFNIPYSSRMGLISLKPLRATGYFYSIAKEKGLLARFKITCLNFFCWSKYLILKLRPLPVKEIVLDDAKIALNTQDLNYIQDREHFGLKLDRDFINYRIAENPYNRNYFCYTFFINGQLKASAYYNITASNIGYLIHLHLDKALPQKQKLAFIKKLVLETKLQSCIAIRFWGFDHNAQNRSEIDLLKKAGFTFLNRGISFVHLEISSNFDYDFNHFVISRMASQGTD